MNPRSRGFTKRSRPAPEAGGPQSHRLPRLDEGLPQGDRVLVLDVELVAGRAGVAGSGSEDREAGDLAVGDPEAAGEWGIGGAQSVEDAACGGALEREQRRRPAAVLDLHARTGVFADPAVRGVDVGRVHAEEDLVLADPREHHVVDAAAAFVEQEPVTRLSDRQGRDLAGHEFFGGGEGALAAQLDLTHVRDVEEARALAHGFVLLLDRGVLHGHLVSREGNEAGTEALVGRVERGPPELVGHAPPSPLRLL
jgi:hypothetical protein